MTDSSTATESSLAMTSQMTEGAAEAEQISSRDHHHHHHEDDDHDHEEGSIDHILKGQMDYFNVVISKPVTSEKMIFSCQSKAGVLEINAITMTHSKFNPSKPSFVIPNVNLGVYPNELSEDRLNAVITFAELPEEVQDSIETYLQEHGLNHDIAPLLYYCLFKFDAQHDQRWATKASAFLKL
jgi:hypothetical protein